MGKETEIGGVLLAIILFLTCLNRGPSTSDIMRSEMNEPDLYEEDETYTQQYTYPPENTQTPSTFWPETSSPPTLSCGANCLTISEFQYNPRENECGDPNSEYVVLSNICPYSCNLTGWQIKDSETKRPAFFFPPFILMPQSMVKIHSGCGINSRIDLYWCNNYPPDKCHAVWNNKGDTLYLYDADGFIILIYTYP